MAQLLYRLGLWSFRRRRLVLVGWVMGLVLAGFGGATMSGNTSDQFTLPGIESVEAFDLIQERDPRAAPDGATARLVFEAPEGGTLRTHAAVIERSLADLAGPHIASVLDPETSGLVSADGRTGVAIVSYAEQSAELEDRDKEQLNEAADIAREGGLNVAVGGDVLRDIPAPGPTELMGLVVAVVVLLLTFGSLLTAGMPLLSAVLGVGIGVGAITAATGYVELGSSTPLLATMLGLAVGIDYALFIVSRFRSELRLASPEIAAARAVGTAGSAVVFAGLTVVIALAGLAVVNIRFLSEMGLAAAATVLVAVAIALTLLPALFGFAGPRMSRSLSSSGAPDADLASGADEKSAPRTTLGRRWVTLVTTHRAITLVAGLAVAAIIAAPVTSLRLALPDDGTAPQETGQRQAFDQIAAAFGPGYNGPLMIVVDTEEASDATGAVEAVVEELRGLGTEVAAVIPPVADEAGDAERSVYQQQLADASYATVAVIPSGGPSDESTVELVRDIRALATSIEQSTGSRILVTGQTALAIDVSGALAEAFPEYLALIIGLALLLLLVAFRSVVIPIKAVLGFLVSVLVSLGATVAVFQWGWMSELVGLDQGGPVMNMLPLLLTGILFGLAMDYEVFLVSRMREEFVHGAQPRDAVVRGFEHGARVVTAAALIMIAVFGSFALGDDVVIKSIGFGLAVGILVDAFLVRMTLVPAFMALLGAWSWWLPRWLDRLVPNLDLEGQSLERPSAQGDETAQPLAVKAGY